MIAVGNDNLFAGATYNISGQTTISDNWLFNAAPMAAVPEPASLTVWGLGALGCAIGAYRRRKSAQQQAQTRQP